MQRKSFVENGKREICTGKSTLAGVLWSSTSLEGTKSDRTGIAGRATTMTPPEQSSSQEPRASAEQMNVADLLRERIRLDNLLQQQFRRDITLLFTDIRGSTSYFEQHGDLSGRQMVQRHNDLLFPLVTQHEGTVLKTLGDTIMASYGEATAAVQSAIAMQRALRDYNAQQAVSDQIHIRIGINSGQALIEAQDVFGDVVNVASRVESCALPDQILISSATYTRLTDTIPCTFLGATQVKGKRCRGTNVAPYRKPCCCAVPG
jgi:class 3 adenylate cyclase